MGAKTGIEWTDATWNPVTGCTKVSAGCKFCYAERDFHRPYPERDFSDVRCHPDRLAWPLRWRGSKQAKAEGRRSRIFVNSMSDLFHESVPFEFIDKVCGMTHACAQHTFQILTKRPIRMVEYDYWRAANNPHAPAWPSNVWLGVSVEDQKTADERVPLLIQTPAAVHWVSYEPAIKAVDFRFQKRGYLRERISTNPSESLVPIDWVVAGGESGPHARPSHPDWFRSAKQQCGDAGIPLFMKQITEKGRKIPFEQWPEDLQIREFPIEGEAR